MQTIRIIFGTMIAMTILGTITFAIIARKKGGWNFESIKKLTEIENVWKIGVSVLICYSLLWYFFPMLWSTLIHQPVFWLDQVVICFVFLLFREEKGKITGPGSVILSILLVGNLYMLWETWPWSWVKVKTLQSALASTVTPPSNRLSLPYLPVNEKVKVDVEKFWKEQIEKKQIDQDGAEKMIKVCGNESRFNQFETDGTTPYRGRIDRQDVGVCQINEAGIWPIIAEAIGYDIHTLQGNLEMSLWIYHRASAGEWNASGEPRKGFDVKNYDVLAPVAPQKSDRIPMWKKSNNSVDGPVLVFDDKGKSHDFDKGGELDVSGSKWIEYQSRSGEAVKIHVSQK